MTALLDSWRAWPDSDKEKLLRELQLLKARNTYTTPGALARVIAPSESVQTPALDILDQALVDAESGKQPWLIFSMPPQEGKLVADDTPVPTPGGWVRHGDLRPGSVVFHPSGEQVKVAEVHPPAQATMRVRFSDHTSVPVHPSHEWTVWDRGRGGWITLETRALAAVKLSHGTPGKRGHKYRFHLPHREPLDCPDADLPVDPYTLGVWLGDGSTSKPAVTHHPDDHYELPYTETARCVHPATGIITTYYGGGMRLDLIEAGVLGNKHIPAPYLRASISQRRALLAGLIDTDGHVAASGQVFFDNADAALVHGVAELIRSLGYRAHVHRPTPPKLSTSGIQGKLPMWRVTFTPHDQGPARLHRKAAVKLGRRERIAIIAIEEEAPQSGRCITVDREDGLYLVGEGMLPTHNSQRVSRMFPIWCLLRNPERRIAIASYADDIAMRWGRQIRDDITANPDLGLALHPGISAAREWQLDGHRGGVITTGVGGALTGRPVDVMIIDDPLKDREESESPTMRERCINFWRSKASTRLPETSIVVLIMTRWHEDDLAGFLVREHPDDFKLINIPAQAEHVDGNDDCKCAGDGKCLGYEVLGRQPGQYMESTRARTDAGWELRKRSAGSYDWAALFQGHPSPAEGGELKRHWWRRFPHHLRAVQKADQTMHAVGAGVVVMTIDCAFKDQDSSDYVCFQVWAAKGSRAWLLDQVCERMSFTATVAELQAFAAKWPQATRKFIEDKANGPAVVSALRGKVGGLIEYTPTDSKLARVRSVAPFCEAGDVEIPEDAPFTQAFVDQCAAFPNGANDDMVDCLSLALIKLLLLGLGNQFMDDLVAEHARSQPRDFAHLMPEPVPAWRPQTG